VQIVLCHTKGRVSSTEIQPFEIKAPNPCNPSEWRLFWHRKKSDHKFW